MFMSVSAMASENCRNPSMSYHLSFLVCAQLFLLPAATKLGQSKVFTGVCDSVHRGEGGLRQGEPPQQGDPPWQGEPPPGKENPPSMETPPGKENPPPGQGEPPQQGDPPGKETPPPSIRSMSGRYASYWNAFLSYVFSYLEKNTVETNQRSIFT